MNDFNLGTPESETERFNFTVAVVAKSLDENGKRTHTEAFVKLNQFREEVAVAYRDVIAKEGFTYQGETFYPDQLESVQLILNDEATEDSNGEQTD